MALKYYPRNGEVLMCDFKGFIVPEMVKRRPVVIIGPRLRDRGDLATIVPSSTSSPNRQKKWQVKIRLQKRLPPPFNSEEAWAICDLVCSISTTRLDRFKQPRPRYGVRANWVSSSISKEHLDLIREGVLHGLGFSALTKGT